MFGNPSLPSCVYKFGADAPTLHADLVNDEMRKMHRYRNRLVEIERSRREAVERALINLRPGIAEINERYARADAAVESALQIMRQKNSESRTTRSDKGALAEIKTAKAARKIAYDQRKSARAEAFADPAVKLRLAEIDAADLATRKAARGESGLYWGNYMIVENSCSGIRSGAPPIFQRWDWDGQIGVQIQGGLDADGIFEAADSRLQIDAPHSAAMADWSRRAVHRRTVCRMRIGSSGRSPIWTEFPILMHRPLPHHSRIKWAMLVRKRIGTQFQWSLNVTVSAAGGFAKPGSAAGGTVGIDVGWRMLDAGLRVAYWIGSDGREGELVLPMADLQRWKKSEELQSIRDSHFNGAVSVLAAWRDGDECPSYAADHATWLRRQSPHNDVERNNLNREYMAWRGLVDSPLRTIAPPEWFGERAKNIRLWKSPAQLASLVLGWRDIRFAGDELIFPAMEEWRRRDKHLYEWQANQTRKAIAWRKNLYRNFASMMRKSYRVAAIEDCNWATMQKNAEADETPDPHGLKLYMRHAAVGDLLQTIRQAMSETASVPAENTTRIHFLCGELSGEKTPSNLYHQCEKCGVIYDQDRNAAENLLRAASGDVAAQTP